MNRPANSLTTILLPWMPQTCAPIAKRVAAVKGLLSELPGIGWELLPSLLPRAHSTTGARRPAWRSTIPDNWQDKATSEEYWEQVCAYSELAIAEASEDVSKLTLLIGYLGRLPPPAHEQLLKSLASDAVRTMPEADRLPIWEKLDFLVRKHRSSTDAAQAEQPEQLERIASIAEQLAPSAPFFLHQRLFSERDFELYEYKGNYREQSERLERQRHRAIEEIAADGGVETVLTFAKTVESPWRVGIAFGIVAEQDSANIVLPGLLASEDKSLTQFIGGFVRGRFRGQGWQWVDSAETSQWTPDQVGQFLSFLPFAQDTWMRSGSLLGEDESAYWTKTTANPYEAQEGLEIAVDQLLRHGRPVAAIRCLHKMLYDGQPFDNTTAVRVLLEALQSSEGVHSMDTYEIVEIIGALQNDPMANPDDLFRVEWAYLPLLDNQDRASPRLLERRLTEEPGSFCELIRLVFRSHKDHQPAEESTEGRRNIASNAYRLLSAWRTPPGWRGDGTFDGDALTLWLDSVRQECTETGHLETAMTMVGHVLVHVPADPDGLWIHRSAAALLNARDAEDMRLGFSTELYNLRGPHWIDPTGKPERELAANYRAKAEALDEAGYPRLAATLRQLADTYEHEAEQVSSRGPFDD